MKSTYLFSAGGYHRDSLDTMLDLDHKVDVGDLLVHW